MKAVEYGSWCSQLITFSLFECNKDKPSKGLERLEEGHMHTEAEPQVLLLEAQRLGESPGPGLESAST
jgi:hypothetical protein